MVGGSGAFRRRPRFISPAFSGFDLPATGPAAIRFPPGPLLRTWALLFQQILPVFKEFSGIPADMTEQSVATAPRPTPAFMGWLARLLPPALESDDRPYFRDLAALGAALFAATIIAYALTTDWTGAIPRDATTLAVGRDFLNLWMYGRAAAAPDPGQFYDLAAYHQALRGLLGMELTGQNWSYPPSLMLLAAPFGQLNYLAALACWTLIGVAVFVTVAGRHVPDWRVLIPVVLSPAALFCLISGQSSFLTAAVLIAVFAELDRRPVAKGLPVQGLVLADPERIATPFFATVFMNLRGLDLGYAAAMSVQAVFSALALAAVVWAFRFRRDADPGLLLALYLACSAIATPYLLAYDLLPLTFAAVALLAGSGCDAPGRRLVQLVYWTAALQLAFGTYHLPGPALIAPAFVAYLFTRLWRN